ncbi:response regulator [Microbispora sp. NPDC088329]|uniref:response regulator n=1 Tax=Microbispora sp. NPDC088329 TaxID=3154869 RepID=UPI0034183FDB
MTGARSRPSARPLWGPWRRLPGISFPLPPQRGSTAPLSLPGSRSGRLPSARAAAISPGGFRKAARLLLEADGLAVVGTASGSVEALRRLEEAQPDVVLVDIDLGVESGFDLARLVMSVADPPHIPVPARAEAA